MANARLKYYKDQLDNGLITQESHDGKIQKLEQEESEINKGSAYDQARKDKKRNGDRRRLFRPDSNRWRPGTIARLPNGNRTNSPTRQVLHPLALRPSWAAYELVRQSHTATGNL